MSSPRDRETEELLDELESTLEALRDEIDGRDRRRRRPPTPLELLRFAERRAIPTLVATLEAAVEALELVREVLSIVDPERPGRRARLDEADDRRGLAGRSAAAGAERVLADLRRALTAEGLPDDEAARDLVSEARELSGEVEARIREARERSGAARSPSGGGGVRIDVTADGTREQEGREREGGGATDAGVDVDAELESLRNEVRGDQDETR